MNVEDKSDNMSASRNKTNKNMKRIKCDCGLHFYSADRFREHVQNINIHLGIFKGVL